MIIFNLLPNDRLSRSKFLVHLLDLNETDKRNRFSGSVNSDFIIRYFNNISENDDIIEAYSSLTHHVVGYAHISYMNDSAEIGFSIDSSAQGNGYGSQLFQYCIDRCRNLHNVKTVWTYCMSNNLAVKKIVQKCGLNIDLTDTSAACGEIKGFDLESASRLYSQEFIGYWYGMRKAIRQVTFNDFIH